MLLALLKRAVKAALHEAAEEWALECGLPLAVVDEMRSKRLARAARAAARADDRAAAGLGVEDDVVDGAPPALALPVPAAARVTAANDAAPTSDDEDLFMAWVDGQREAQIGWAEIARASAEGGRPLTEEALRSRYRRWRERNGQGDGEPPRPA